MRQRPHQQLSEFIAAKRATDDRGARRRSPSELGTARATGLVFSPQRHGLSWEQCRLAASLLARAERRRPFTGSPERVGFLRALRIAGILSAVRHGRVGASAWGHRMLATQGGLAMARHAPHVLRANAPRASQAAQAAKERREAAHYFETHGVPLPLGAKPTDTMEQQRLRDLTELWEQSEWQTQRDRLSW